MIRVFFLITDKSYILSHLRPHNLYGVVKLISGFCYNAPTHRDFLARTPLDNGSSLTVRVVVVESTTLGCLSDEKRTRFVWIHVFRPRMSPVTYPLRKMALLAAGTESDVVFRRRNGPFWSFPLYTRSFGSIATSQWRHEASSATVS